MASEFTFPSNAQITEIAQDKLPVLTQDDPIFGMFPMVSEDTTMVMWEQRDNYKGLQQIRGEGGQPARVAFIGGKRFSAVPGYYGEFIELDELQLTERRRWGQFGQPADISDLVMEAQDQLLQRHVDLCRFIAWNAAMGSFSIAGPNGAIMHAGTYTTQTSPVSVDWDTLATATPLADLRAVKKLHRGHSVSFGRKAVAYGNQTTIDYVLSNLNPADFYGRRTAGLATVNNLADVNQILTSDDICSLAVYDEGYFDESGTFQLFIPDNVLIVFGVRPAGQPVGKIKMVRNANNDGAAAGPYQRVVDNADGDPPRLIKVHHGANIGVSMEYPSSIVTLQVVGS